MSCPGMAMLRTRAGLGRAEAALKHAHRRCPFLARNPGVVALPTTQTIKAAPAMHGDKEASAKMSSGAPAPAMQPEALKLLASRCPVMAPVIHSPGMHSVSHMLVFVARPSLHEVTSLSSTETCCWRTHLSPFGTCFPSPPAQNPSANLALVGYLRG